MAAADELSSALRVRRRQGQEPGSPLSHGPPPDEDSDAQEMELARFHWTPKKGWDRFARGMHCLARSARAEPSGLQLVIAGRSALEVPLGR